MITSRLSLIIGIVAMFVLCGCAAVSQPVYQVPEKNDCTDSGKKDGKCTQFDGVPYVLPRTALKVTIPVVKKTTREGSFVSEAREIFAVAKSCEWDEKDGKPYSCGDKTFSADELKKDACIKHVFDRADALGVKIAVDKPDDKPDYRLGDVLISSEAQPDPDQLYFVEVKGGMFEHRSLDISFASGGVLNDITSSAEDRTVEFAAKTFGSILGAAAKVAAFGKYEASEDTEGTTFKKNCGGSPYQNLVYRAMGTLDYITNFPVVRMQQLTENIPNFPKDTLELRLKELDATNGAARAVFEAGKKSESKSYEVTLLPKSKGSTIQIATFNKDCGLYRTVQLSETMPSSNVPQLDKNLNGCKITEVANVQAIFSTPHQMTGLSLPVRISKSLDAAGNTTRGIYYRVPETTRISLKKDNDDLLIKDIPIAQFGETASLPAQTGSSNVTYKVTLDPVTGMLLKVNISSEAASTSAAKDFIDPVGDYLKASKSSNDELTQLQRQEAILKAKKSIKDLNTALGQ